MNESLRSIRQSDGRSERQKENEKGSEKVNGKVREEFWNERGVLI